MYLAYQFLRLERFYKEVIGMNLLVDIAYAYIDPRIKAKYMGGR